MRHMIPNFLLTFWYNSLENLGVAKILINFLKLSFARITFVAKKKILTQLWFMHFYFYFLCRKIPDTMKTTTLLLVILVVVTTVAYGQLIGTIQITLMSDTYCISFKLQWGNSSSLIKFVRFVNKFYKPLQNKSTTLV